MKRKRQLPLQTQHQVFITYHCYWFLQLFCLKSTQLFCRAMPDWIYAFKLKHSWALECRSPCWYGHWCEGSPFQAVLLPAKCSGWVGRQGTWRALPSRQLACSPLAWRVRGWMGGWVWTHQPTWPHPLLVGVHCALWQPTASACQKRFGDLVLTSSGETYTKTRFDLE